VGGPTRPRTDAPADAWQDRTGGAHRHARTGRDLCPRPQRAVRFQASGGPRSAAEPVLFGLHFPVAVGFRRRISPLPARSPACGRESHLYDGYAPDQGASSPYASLGRNASEIGVSASDICGPANPTGGEGDSPPRSPVTATGARINHRRALLSGTIAGTGRRARLRSTFQHRLPRPDASPVRRSIEPTQPVFDRRR
jgi:hypothetical protein